MDPWAFLFTWIGSLSLAWAFGVSALLHRPVAMRGKELGALLASELSTVPSFVTLLIFIHVFVVGGSSNVAQLAGEGGRGLWRIWAGTWPLSLLANLGAFLLCLVATFYRPSLRCHGLSFASLIFAATAAGNAIYALLRFAPDA